jgi:hypothetical protein
LESRRFHRPTRNQYIGSSFLRRLSGRCEREGLMLPNLIARW